jgi:hypothetical protein
MAPLSLSGIHGLLRRLKIHYKRGRRHLHSPDLHYDEKLTEIARIRQLVREEPGRFVMLYEDELSCYRQPSVAQGYAPAGTDLPHARQHCGFNTYERLAGSLDIRTGRFFCWQRRKFDRHTLVLYYQALAKLYPDAETIYIAQDNWPVHFHEEILVALAQTKIRLVSLPTYAPWTNPVEKVWRKLFQEVLHHHPFSSDWSTFRTAVRAFLDQFVNGSPDLLRYVGLLAD